MFSHLSAATHDPIMSLMQDYLRNPHPQKVNLGIGLYYDADGKIPLLESVQKAETQLHQQKTPYMYPPIEGLSNFTALAQQLLFGQNDPRIVTVQTLGGSGALKLGATFLRQHFSESHVWMSDPTWPNHLPIFSGVGIPIHHYPYFDASTGLIAFDEMLVALAQLPEKSIVLLHACCHNPTGSDLSDAQWLSVIDILTQRKLIPFIDIAYHGFGNGINEDIFVVNELQKTTLTFFVSQSFSKNFALYGQRCGTLSVVCPDREQAILVLGQLRNIIRASYSCPPIKGAQIVETVLASPVLKAQWLQEVEEMRARMISMRHRLQAGLQHNTAIDVSRFTLQKGMFSYTGLTDLQLKQLREEYAIYLVSPGRMCIAGLNAHNIDYVIEAINTVI